MQAIRHLFEHAPATIPVPEGWREKPLEVILLRHDSPLTAGVPAAELSREWPSDYFESTFASIPDFPEREFQGVGENREPME
ncbi:MAG: hypothetical protein HQL56_05895 [Magnetococcales bacterium]|nr:hypothetical protein [Magnetococcales bacterium]